MKYCMIEVAFGIKKEANKAVDELLNKRLVASCQILESNSIWNWKQKREQSKEYIVLMKTQFYLQNKIYNVIKNIHSYECFEFAVFELSSCNEDYLNWIESEMNRLLLVIDVQNDFINEHTKNILTKIKELVDSNKYDLTAFTRFINDENSI